MVLDRRRLRFSDDPGRVWPARMSDLVDIARGRAVVGPDDLDWHRIAAFAEGVPERAPLLGPELEALRLMGFLDVRQSPERGCAPALNGRGVAELRRRGFEACLAGPEG